jgi:hypothetical protein
MKILFLVGEFHGRNADRQLDGALGDSEHSHVAQVPRFSCSFAEML